MSLKIGFRKVFAKSSKKVSEEISTEEENGRHCRLSHGQVLTTLTYEHGIHDIQRLHSGECRIRLRRNQPREIFRTHLNAVSAHTLEGALVSREKEMTRGATNTTGGVSNDGNLINAPRIGHDRPSSNRKNRTEDKSGARRSLLSDVETFEIFITLYFLLFFFFF